MNFDSTFDLPATMSRHTRISWQLCEQKLSAALRSSGFRPPRGVYIQGCHAVAGSDGRDVYNVLLMMPHAPGDAEVLSIAATTARLLDRDGLASYATEAADAAD